MTTTTAAEAAVVDASVLFEYVAPGPGFETVEPLFAGDVQAWIPDHSLVEVANALRKHQRSAGRGRLEDIGEALEDLLGLRPMIVGCADLIQPAVRHMSALTAYDAVYVTLAEVRDIPLCTLDRAQAKAAERLGVEALLPGTGAFASWIDRRR